MPRLTGIDFLKTLTRPPLVIMTTAYRQFALDGYELDVVDFLLKPILFERFMKAVGKAFQRQSPDSPETTPVAGSAAQPHLYIRLDREMVKVLLGDIVWIESLKGLRKNLHRPHAVCDVYADQFAGRKAAARPVSPHPSLVHCSQKPDYGVQQSGRADKYHRTAHWPEL